MIRVRRSAAALAFAALLVAAGCGGGGSSSSGQPSGSIKVTMTDFKFDPSTITASSGKVVFFLVNSGGVSHDMVVTDSSHQQKGKSELVQPGNSTTLELNNLAAGSYTFICDQPGHEAAGMKGTLTVS
jgi:uncharacterized cupredoxin-like copper-binding protein